MNRRGFFGTLFGMVLGISLLPKKAKAAEKEAIPHIAYLAVRIPCHPLASGDSYLAQAKRMAAVVYSKKADYIPSGLFFMDSMETEPTPYLHDSFTTVSYVFRFHGRLIWGEKRPDFQNGPLDAVYATNPSLSGRPYWTPTLVGIPVISTPIGKKIMAEYVLGDLS